MFPEAELDGQAWRDSNAAGQVGHTPWNKELTKKTDTRVAKYAEALRGEIAYTVDIETGTVSFSPKPAVPSKEYVLVNCKHLRGYPWSEKRREVARLRSEQVKLLKKDDLKPVSNKMVHDSLGKRHHSEESRKQIALSVQQYIRNLPLTEQEERTRRWIAAAGLKPNKAEQKLDGILQSNFPGEWLYTGEGSFTLGYAIPDFLNVNGKKQLIELYGDYWHQGENPQDRIDYFQSFGFSTLVVWEHELADEVAVVRKVEALNSKSNRRLNSP